MSRATNSKGIENMKMIWTQIRFEFCSLVHSRREWGNDYNMQGQCTTLRRSSPRAPTLSQFGGNIIFMCPPYGAEPSAPLYSYGEVLEVSNKYTLLSIARIYVQVLSSMMQRRDGTQPTSGRKGEVDCGLTESNCTLAHREGIKTSTLS